MSLIGLDWSQWFAIALCAPLIAHFAWRALRSPSDDAANEFSDRTKSPRLISTLPGGGARRVVADPSCPARIFHTSHSTASSC